MKKTYISSLYSILSFLMFTLLFCACEDVIDVDLRSVPPRVVIEGNVRLDSLATVRVTTTKDFSSTNDYPPIENAIVRIWDDAGNAETLTPDAAGTYIAQSIRGVERRLYNLSVTVEDVEYTAVSRMPPVVSIDSLTLFDFIMLDYPMPMVHFKDPEGTENDYYRALAYVNNERPNKRYALMNGDYMDGFDFHQTISLSYDNADEDDEDPLQQGDELMVELQCIDKGVFTFWETLDFIDNSLNNPTSNIQGGALGYFSAYSFARERIIAKW